MSLSLLNEYESSDDSDAETTLPAENSADFESKIIEKKEKNFFIGGSDDSDASTSSANSDDDDDVGQESASTTKPALPRPFDNFSNAGADTSSVSVFRNPFLEAERVETAKLEQHVKLSETLYGNKLDQERERAKQKFRRSSLPCRQFKRGRCRMGDKCRFLHAAFPTAVGSSASASASTGEPTSSKTAEKPTPIYDGKAIRYTEWGKEEVVDDDDQKKPTKKRIGVTNSLIPPKRAMANFEKQRRNEAPWMDDRK